jgi:uncharacterized protein (DUF305 family)
MTAQLGFADLLTEAATTNEQRQMDRATAHLPGTMEEAMPFYRRMIENHHAAMQAADIEQAMSIREEAHQLAGRTPPAASLSVSQPRRRGLFPCGDRRARLL